MIKIANLLNRKLPNVNIVSCERERISYLGSNLLDDLSIEILAVMILVLNSLDIFLIQRFLNLL